MTNSYQPYIEIIDAIIRKASTSGKVISLHALEITSLPHDRGGATDMMDFLLKLKDQKAIGNFDKIAASFRIPNLTATQLEALKKAKDRFLHDDRTAEQPESNIEVVKPTSEPADPNVAYSISLGYRHEIVINNKYQLTRPHFQKANDLVFEFLCANPNKLFTRQQVEEAIGTSIGKPFNTILNELKFKHELRKLFFPNVSKIAIEFKNHHTKSDVLNAKIDEQKLEEQLKSLKLWEDKF